MGSRLYEMFSIVLSDSRQTIIPISRSQVNNMNYIIFVFISCLPTFNEFVIVKFLNCFIPKYLIF